MVEKVGIGQLKVLKGSGVLTAYGLGSCIGLFLYDRLPKVGGLAHIMLSGYAPETLSFSKNKYAENAVSSMLSEMKEAGAEISRTGAVLVGGAHMFHEAYADKRPSIGDKNCEGVREILNRYAIPILAEDVGGDYGRTIEAGIETGNVTVKSFRYGIKEIVWTK